MVSCPGKLLCEPVEDLTLAPVDQRQVPLLREPRQLGAGDGGGKPAGMPGRGVGVLFAGPEADRHADAGEIDLPGCDQGQLVLDPALRPEGEALAQVGEQVRRGVG
jgi:hypothetical protein